MILTINTGSSTIKYQLFSNDVEQVLARGIVSRIGEEGSYIVHAARGKEVRHEIPLRSHHEAFELAVQYLLHPQYGAIHNIDEIEAVGHRAVHGADAFMASTLITDEVLDKMSELAPLAPLHNPPNLVGMREGRSLLRGVPHVAVFDTAFHQTMPPRAYMYALPYRFYEEHRIRRYGFHGTSCRYVSHRAAALLHRPLEQLNSVVCHLGNGVTITAVKGGESVDTSIGFATFGGVMMGTRAGDVDPGLVFHFNRELGIGIEEYERIVYYESGLLGISGVGNDMRVITEAAEAGHRRARLAMDMFAYMIKKYVGAYAAAMGGINCLIFTAGIGENSAPVRRMVCEGLEFLGIRVDPACNTEAVGGREKVISPPGAGCTVAVIPTDEEKMIAIDTRRIANLQPA
jgi:acetate kinase